MTKNPVIDPLASPAEFLSVLQIQQAAYRRNMNPGLEERRIEVDLLGGHRLRLRDLLHALLAGEVDDVPADLLGAPEENDLRAPRLGLPREPRGELREAPGGVALDPGDPASHRLEVDPLVRLRAACGIRLVEAAERSGEVRVPERLGDLLVKRHRHGVTSGVAAAPSWTTTTSRTGPWAPIVRTRSMSAVRLGPVTKEM